MNIMRNRDFISGILMIVVGLFFFLGAFQYTLGTLQRMGSGMFPLLVGATLTVLGIVLAATSVRLEPSVPIKVAWRALLSVGASIAAFALVYDHLGLLPGVAATIAISALGNPEIRLREAALVMLLYVAMAYLIFIFALELSMPAFRIR